MTNANSQALAPDDATGVVKPILKYRSAGGVFWIGIITLGIYVIVWYAKTRGEMKANGARIMSTWTLIVPIVGFVYLWQLSRGIEQVTGASKGANFALLLLLGGLGEAIVQGRINKATPEKTR